MAWPILSAALRGRGRAAAVRALRVLHGQDGWHDALPGLGAHGLDATRLAEGSEDSQEEWSGPGQNLVLVSPVWLGSMAESVADFEAIQVHRCREEAELLRQGFSEYCMHMMWDVMHRLVVERWLIPSLLCPLQSLA